MPDETAPDAPAEQHAPTEPQPQEQTGDNPETGQAPKKKRRRRRRRGKKPAEGQAAANERSAEHDESAEPRDSERAPETDDPDGVRDRDSHDQATDRPKRKRRRRRGKSLGSDDDRRDDRPDDRRDREPRGEAKRDGRPESTAEDARVERVRTKRDASNTDIFDHDNTFADLGLSEEVCAQLADMHFEHPTHIQSQLIPPVLAGRDVLGQAKTGTGKTAAFGMPLLDMVQPGTGNQALILAPTRELAIQIHKEIEDLGHKKNLRSVPIYGGQKIPTQAAKLEKGCEIVVGTPGRIMDMQRRGYLPFTGFRFVVLDEVDRMLDIGFRDDIRYILGRCPKNRQTMFVSATLSPEIEKLAKSYMTNPEKIVTTAGSLTASMVKQHHLPVQPWDKKKLLHHLLTHEEPDLTLVFCRMKRKVDELASYLSGKGIEAHAIHADLAQGKRNRVMEKLRGGQLSVLIASDLASRGIDVDGITHVINYDLPEDIELYVHRIGRTARAGSGGTAWSFVQPEQGTLLSAIEDHINAEIPKLEYPDFEPGTPPPDYLEQQERRAQELERLRAKANRFAVEVPVVEDTAKLDPSKFPGGVVPSKLPPKRLGGRVRGRR
ncbi:MAG: DEAD/DEAH box helicase [Planctomycetota bacterium]